VDLARKLAIQASKYRMPHMRCACNFSWSKFNISTEK